MNAPANSPGILLVTHPGIAGVLLEQGRRILGDGLENVLTVEIDSGDSADRDRVRGAVDQADSGAGVLVMTDLPGATPANVAAGTCAANCRVISGLNLPMLIRAWNYRGRCLAELTDLALEGGRKAVVELE